MRPMDAEQLREQAHKMVDFIADYYKTIENLPVLSQVEVVKFSAFLSLISLFHLHDHLWCIITKREYAFQIT